MVLGDAIAHLLSRQTVIAPDDADNWDIDLGQHVHGRAHDCQRR